MSLGHTIYIHTYTESMFELEAQRIHTYIHTHTYSYIYTESMLELEAQRKQLADDMEEIKMRYVYI